jgi:hypothetical protein
MLAVVVFALSLQHAFFALASFDVFEQLASVLLQDFPLAHFFFLPLSAKATPATNINAVANKITFFMIIFLIDYTNVKIGEKLQSANSWLVKLYGDV